MTSEYDRKNIDQQYSNDQLKKASDWYVRKIVPNGIIENNLALEERRLLAAGDDLLTLLRHKYTPGTFTGNGRTPEELEEFFAQDQIHARVKPKKLEELFDKILEGTHHKGSNIVFNSVALGIVQFGITQAEPKLGSILYFDKLSAMALTQLVAEIPKLPDDVNALSLEHVKMVREVMESPNLAAKLRDPISFVRRKPIVSSVFQSTVYKFGDRS